MRILRVSLRDYRGTVERTVGLAPSGVTIVEGPNEIGKSSIPEAVDHLLDDLDSSTRRDLQAVRPVDRDVGPEVAIEVETGPYAFAYRKRFLRQPITELQLHRPRAEQLTGRAAHDRVQQMLHETVDVALWKALRVSQGDLAGQAKLGRQSSLSQALDRAAGEAPAGDEEHSLFDAAHAEYLRFWTETGRRKQEEVALERSIEETTREIERIATAIGAIEADVESSLDLRTESRRLSEERARLRTRVDELQARVETLAALEAGVAAAEARHEAARLAADAARRALEARRTAALAVTTAGEGHARLEAAMADDATRLDAARGTVAATDETLQATRAERDRARACVETAQARVARARDTAELADLEDRYARGRAANSAMVAAQADAELPVTAQVLGAIREQHRLVELARARLDAVRPHLRIDARSALAGSVDGVPFELATGAFTERRVDHELTIDLPGVAAIVVSAGTATDQQGDELARAETRLTELLRDAGAADPADAERIHARHVEGARTVAEQRRVRESVLQGASAKQMAQRIVGLRERLAVDTPETGTDGPVGPAETAEPFDLDQARRDLAATERTLQEAERAWDSARTGLLAMELAVGRRETEARLTAEEGARREAALAAERAAAPDEQLATRLDEDDATERRTLSELIASREELARQGADEARRDLAEARRTLDQVDVEIRLVQDRLLEVTTRLRDHGEDGLAEDLLEEQSKRDHLEADLRRYRSQAAARRLLFETLRDERDRAQRSYVAPLRREIERLGRMVFGDGFAVELDESTLEVASRTQDGRTIPFRSLSVGTQEQIAIIGRLACATIVAPDGGVPVILDDALGNSDPERLAAMGEALAAAGEQCQIIVLTSQPDRYEHVAAATVVRLA